ncbi:DUF6064 family protein [Thalassomonas actiniarum]|uniref:MFS transporter permease n=1 Tax=Thalassomonas actiniarum TaxID=485447 RepID=A0AAF0C1V8_9GAMM|nr:DUF6064 family protein [Thalassomonas actiniarum]WDD97852.1 hypothetical protein SG35_021535 [Thalassomonas actiniarum]
MLEQLFLYLSDFLMFMPESYSRLITHYNQAVWPLPLFTLLLGAVNLVLIKSRYLHRNRLVNLSLACHWLWVGLVFHYHYFSTINWAAPAFALLFSLQAALLFFWGVIKNKIHYQAPFTPVGYAGLFIYLFVLLLYPALTAYWHQGRQSADYYGVGADATCLATLGLLLMTNSRSRYYLLLPLLWCLLSAAMAWMMAFKQSLLLAGMPLLVGLLKVFPAIVYRVKNAAKHK